MYDVNLIRKRIVPERHKRVMFSVFSGMALVYALTFLGVAIFSMANLRMADVYAHEIERIEQDTAALSEETPTRDELDGMLSGVAPDLREIGTLLDQRVPMAPVWAAIARAVPEGIWLTRVEVTQPRQTNGGSKKKVRSDPKSAGGITIEGCAIASEPAAGSEAIKLFEKNIEGDEVLGQIVSEVESAETGMRKAGGGSSVVGFVVRGTYKS
jgi:Tfp pilus assembly protein PilN